MTKVRRLSFSILALFFLLALCPISAFAQTKVTIRGTVMDETSQPVPGAAVLVKGVQGQGTMADEQGNFEITANPGSTLVITSLGYKNQEKKITDATVLTIVLETDAELLDDVVVVGYGVQKKESVVGAISTVSSEALVQSGQTNITNAIAGKLSGVQTFQSTGRPGADDATIYIRGLSTMDSKNEGPLIMVDGVERSFSELDPNEVDNISVLKDASATAVFGAKGANGVILVTTKTGSKGKPKMGLSVNYGLESPQSVPKHIDAETTLNIYNDALRSQGSFSAQYSDDIIEKYKSGTDKARYPDTDWYDLILKDFAQTVNASYNVTGGGEKVKYYANVGYNNQGSIVKNFTDNGSNTFSYDRINYRLNLDFNLTKTTDLAVKVGGNTTVYSNPTSAAENASSVDHLFTVMYQASGLMFPPYYGEEALRRYPDPDYPGDYTRRIADKGSAYYANPYFYVSMGDYEEITSNQLATDIDLTQKLDFITKGLYAKAKASYTTVFSRISESAAHRYATYYVDWGTVDANSGANPWVNRKSSGNEVYIDTPYEIVKDGNVSSARNTYYWEASLNYSRSFGGHNISALALMNQRNVVSSAGYPSRSEAHVGRINYDYKAKYLLEANISRTGSEQFSPDYRFGIFPSIALGYVVSKENWWKQAMPWWSKFKIRYSDGIVGSDKAQSSWLYYSSFSKSGNLIYESSSANLTARWETAHKRDLGFEMGWFEDALVLDVDLFDEYRKDILLNPSAQVTMLVQSTYKDINAGEMKKHGIDIDLKWRKTTASGLFYEIGGMVGLNENRIVKYCDAAYAPDYQKYEGKAVGAMYLGETPVGNGYYNTVDEMHGYPNAVTSMSLWQLGSLKCLDYNSDGAVDVNDRHPVVGSTVPPVNYSGHVSLQYKNLSFYAMLYGVAGKYIDFNNSYYQEFNGNDLIVHVAQLDFWTPDNQNASHPSPSLSNRFSPFGGGTSGGDFGLMGQTWRKSDYVSLKEVNLSYRIPDLNGFLGVKGLIITLTGNNLMTWTGLIEGDPEIQQLKASYYPLMRTIKLGVKLDF